MLLHAEQNRISVTEAEEALATDNQYSSPFIAMPF
jgi:hypothetical protein